MAHILLVEDDPLIYRMYQKVFQLEGLDLAVASDGQDGLQKVQAQPPDLILLDVMMPIMNGVELLEKLKEDPKTTDIPVIMLTNLSNMQITQDALSKGALFYIVKSETEPDRLVQIVRDTLNKLANKQEGASQR